MDPTCAVVAVWRMGSWLYIRAWRTISDRSICATTSMPRWSGRWSRLPEGFNTAGGFVSGRETRPQLGFILSNGEGNPLDCRVCEQTEGRMEGRAIPVLGCTCSAEEDGLL